MKIRIRFGKYGALKFIGHLDMMRYFQKALRRAEIDMKYSEGFNPHMIMSFAAPLGVGITSDGEYFDIEVLSSEDSKTALKKLNDVMVEGVKVYSYRKLPDQAKTAMSIVAAADYELSFKEGYEIPKTLNEFQDMIVEFYEKSETIPIIKQTKKSERELDLKPLIYDFKVLEREGKPVFYIKTSTGSVDNIKPELVLSAMYQKFGLEYKAEAIQIHRLDTYARNEKGQFVPLEMLGEDIA